MNFLAKENRFSRFAVQTYSAIALVGAMVFEFLISNKTLGVGAAIFFSALLIVYTLFLHVSGHIRQKWALVFLLPLVFLFGSFSWYADQISSAFLYPVSLVLSVLFFVILTVHIKESTRFHILSIPVIRKFFTPLFKKLNDLSQIIIPASLRKHDLEKSRLVIIGIVISLPLVIFFTALLMSADADFRDVIVSMFRRVSVFVDAHTWLHIFKIILLWLLFSSLFFVITRFDHEVQEKILKVEKFNETIIGTIITMINILFASFIIVQFTHLFGSYEYVRVNSMIFSEYARQGFNQLIMVSCTALLIFFVTYRSLIFHGMRRLLRISQAFFLVQVGVIALSAFNRINLYEQAYGYTIKRLLVEWFSVTLIVMVVVMAIAVLWRQSFRNVVYTQAIVLIFALCALPLMRIEYRVAYHNINRFVTGNTKQLDLVYVDSLSNAAFPALGLLTKPEIVENLTVQQIAHVKSIFDAYQASQKELSLVEYSIHHTWSDDVATQIETVFKDRFAELEERKQVFLDILNEVKQKEIRTTCESMNVRIQYTVGIFGSSTCAKKDSNMPDPYRSFIYAIPNNYRYPQGKTMISSFLQSVGYKPGTKEIETVFIPLRSIELPNFPTLTEGQDMPTDTSIDPSLVEYVNKYILTNDGKMFIFDISNYRYQEYDVRIVYDTRETNQYRIEFVLLREQ